MTPTLQHMHLKRTVNHNILLRVGIVCDKKVIAQVSQNSNKILTVVTRNVKVKKNNNNNKGKNFMDSE